MEGVETQIKPTPKAPGALRKTAQLAFGLKDGRRGVLNVAFPLEDGRTLVQGPLAYEADGLYTRHNADFLCEPRFARAYAAGMETIRSRRPGLQVGWRVHTCLWAASQAARLDGDFVECGVFTGIYSRAIIEYLDFGKMTDRKFWLLDTFEGIPEESLNASEGERLTKLRNRAFFHCYEEVQATFAPFPNVRIVKGRVPLTLPEVTAEKVAYLSLDMNAAEPEIAAARHFWERLVPGAVMVLDDYGFTGFETQKRAFDDFAREKNIDLLRLPTGQAVIVKT